MINSLFLHNFKAFKNHFSLNCDGDNILLYGENGAGKTSLFEGVKFFYFKERLLRERIAPNVVGQARIEEEKRVLDEYKYEVDERMTVRVDGVCLDSHDAKNDSVFLISFLDIAHLDTVSIERLVNTAYYSNVNIHTGWISGDFINMIINCVNEDLENFFWMADVKVQSVDDHGTCSVQNSQNKIPKSKNLYKFFNESVIHIINFIILIAILC